MGWKSVFSWMECSLPFMVMVLAVTALAINMITSKLAMSNGISFYILSVYSHALATLILFPCAFFIHRSKRPPLTLPILCKIFLLALFGYLADICCYAGINSSSPALGSELLNIVPGFTYILAIVFRMEGLNLRRSSDISKSLGTIVSIVGASIVTLYKGPALTHKALNSGFSGLVYSSQQNWILGGVLLVTAAFSTAAWNVYQTSILKVYPAKMMLVAIYCLFETIQGAVVALIAEKDLTAWKLQADIGLVAVVYAGIMNIIIRLYMISWCLTKKGPLFVSLFNPLTIVISVVIGVIFFNEVLYFGSVAGAVVLVIGFYAVMWGKAKENKMNAEFTSHDVPLLQDYIEEA